LAKHVGTYKSFLKGKYNYVTSFKIIELGNYLIVLIENCPCENKDELYKRERLYIETLECVNKYIPNRTQKEWNIENREKIKDYQKEYRNANIETIKNYRIDNKEKNNEKFICSCCGGKYTCIGKSQHLKTEKHINSINNINKLFKKYKNIKKHIDLILSDLSNQSLLQVV
jgi:hypothetical protein